MMTKMKMTMKKMNRNTKKNNIRKRKFKLANLILSLLSH